MAAQKRSLSRLETFLEEAYESLRGMLLIQKKISKRCLKEVRKSRPHLKTILPVYNSGGMR